MEYYIQGNIEKAAQIRAAFEELGIRVPECRSCMDGSLIYFSLNKEVFAVTIKALELFENRPDYKELELPKPHYDITNFHAGMPVLVRNSNDSKWYLSYYGFYDATMTVPFKFICINGESWKQCIPFNDDTEHLLGTTDPCDEQYINW